MEKSKLKRKPKADVSLMVFADDTAAYTKYLPVALPSNY